MSLYTKARKHINMDRVKNLHEQKIAKQIALAEKQYLLYFAENTVPRYYDWETGQFNENPLIEIKSTVLKRLEEIENALEEGMKMKDFNYLYGGEVGSIITSINPTLVSSTFAQDLISASGEVTSTMFGPDFPGSHINSIGDFNPQSYSKVDVVATASWNSVQDVTPSGWTPENSFEYNDSVSDVVSPGQETDTFKDTHFGEVTISGTDISLSTGNDDDKDNTVDIEDLKTLFPGITFPKGVPDQHGEVYDPAEASMILRTFKSVSAGQVISFDYSFTSLETEEDTAGIIGPTGLETIQSYRGANREISGGDGNADDYGFVLVGNSVEKIVSVFAKDGNNSDFNFTDVDGQFKPEILQSRFPLTGKYSYTVKQSDIDSHGNLKFFIGVMDGDGGSFESNLDITNLSTDNSRVAAGQLGKTTDAYNLGTSVASLDPNKKKKKKDEEEKKKKEEEKEKEKEEVKKKEEEKKYNSWIESLPEEQAAKIKSSPNPDRSYYNPLDSGQVMPGQVKVKYDMYGAPTRYDQFDQILANPGEKADSLGLYLSFNDTEADFAYWKGRRYRKGTYADTGIRQSNGKVYFTSKELKNKWQAHYDAIKANNPKLSKNEVFKLATKGDFPGARPFVDVGEQAPAESDGLEGLLDSENLKNKYGEGLFAEFGKIYQKLNTIKDAGKAFAAFLLQQQGVNKYTKNNPYEVQIPAEDKKAIADAINELLETEIPEERWNNLSQADLDLINDRLNPDSGPTPTNPYRKGTGANEDEYHNIFNNLGEKDGIKVEVGANGKPYVSEINDNYVFTDPDDATVSGAPELIKFFTTALGAQKRKGAAGGGKYTYQQYSGNIGELDLKMKNMPIRMKLPTPVSEELYPGQPSPNGFPDTPPPKMINGYHPEFGKRSNRYRRLDPVSAVMMNKVGTDDPETNKQVAAAAKKPKVKLVPNTRSKTDKVTEAVWPKGLWSKAKRHW